jgi:hypothetical protein
MRRQDNQRRDRVRRPAVLPARYGLGAHEAYAFWQGMRDRPGSLGTGFLAGFMEDIFGIRPRPVFRDERMEAIRRLTICFRQGLADRLAIELPLARTAGVTENQIAALRSRIGHSSFASG